MLADPVLLGQHDDRAALGRLVGERGDLGRLGQLAPRGRPASARTRSPARLPSVIVPVLSSSSTSTSPEASTARPDSASTLRRTSRSMPAMPMADSSAPIVVGISATSSAISVATDAAVSANSANGRSVTTTTRKIERQAREQDVERDLVRRLAPLGALDQGDHAVEEALARLLRDLDHDAVREHAGAAGDRAAVAAGLADHRRGLAGDGGLVDRGDALDHRAVAGDQLAGLDDDDVAALRARRRLLAGRRAAGRPSRCASPAGASAWALPRPSASASARLANTTVSQSQSADGEA